MTKGPRPYHEATRPALGEVWVTPKYPGDSARITYLSRGDEIGDVRIQDYGDLSVRRQYRVATFLPGNESMSPGDTPKMEPEKSQWFDHHDRAAADRLFDAYVVEAQLAGWVRTTVTGRREPIERSPLARVRNWENLALYGLLRAAEYQRRAGPDWRWLIYDGRHVYGPMPEPQGTQLPCNWSVWRIPG